MSKGYRALTLKVRNEIVPAVFLRITADESRSEDVTRLRPLGAYLSLASPRNALRVVRVFKDRVRPFAQPLSKGGELGVWIRKSVRKYHRCQVKSSQPWDRLGLQSLVVLVNDRSRVRNVSPPVALPGHMEVRIGVFGEPREEELEERVHVFTRLPTPVDIWPICVLVGEPNTDGLVDEEDVEVLVPAVWVPGNVLPFIRDSARSQFKQQPKER